jgi:hypothetical protein
MIWIICILVLLEAVTLAYAVRFYTYKTTYENWVDGARTNYTEVWERLWDSEERHTQIEASLREQIQHLSEQLASLRMEGAVPERERFVEDPKAPDALSQQLQDFLLAVDTEDARLMVEDDIERMRQLDMSDEQIYDELCKGGD